MRASVDDLLNIKGLHSSALGSTNKAKLKKAPAHGHPCCRYVRLSACSGDHTVRNIFTLRSIMKNHDINTNNLSIISPTILRMFYLQLAQKTTLQAYIMEVRMEYSPINSV